MLLVAGWIHRITTADAGWLKSHLTHSVNQVPPPSAPPSRQVLGRKVFSRVVATKDSKEESWMEVGALVAAGVVACVAAAYGGAGFAAGPRFVAQQKEPAGAMHLKFTTTCPLPQSFYRTFQSKTSHVRAVVVG